MDTITDMFVRGHEIVKTMYSNYAVPFMMWCLYVYGKTYNYVMTLRYPRVIAYNDMTVIEHIVFEDPVYVVRRFVLPRMPVYSSKMLHLDFPTIKTICFNKSYDATSVFKSIRKHIDAPTKLTLFDIYKMTSFHEILVSAQVMLSDNSVMDINDSDLFINMHKLFNNKNE